MSIIWEILKGIFFSILKALLLAFATYIGLCILCFVAICGLEYWLYTSWVGEPTWWMYCIGVVISFFLVKKCIAPIIEAIV